MKPLVTLDDYERAAEPKFDKADWAYLAGGGADEAGRSALEGTVRLYAVR